MKIGICGLGMVGSAIANYYKGLHIGRSLNEVYFYDRYKMIGSFELLNKADIIFVAVPTPFMTNGFDTSELNDALKNISDGKIVIIKSTVEPGVTDKFQEYYPNLKIIFNPEFLTESTRDADFAWPDKQLVGYTEKSYSITKDVLLMLPRAPFERIVPAPEAEMVKLMNNSYYAMKVIFANQIYDFCQKIGLDYDKVLECFVSDKRITNSHFQIFHKEQRGYGGKCLPKDIKALITLAKIIGSPLELLEKVEELNYRLNGGKKK